MGRGINETSEDKLLRYRKMYDAAKATVAKAEGALESTMTRLKDEHGINSIKDLQKKIKDLTGQFQRKQKRLAKLTAEIEERYEL